MVDSDGTGGGEASPAKDLPIPRFVSRILLWLWAHGFRFLGLLITQLLDHDAVGIGKLQAG